MLELCHVVCDTSFSLDIDELPRIPSGKQRHLFRSKFRGCTLKGGPHLADRAVTADHIHKDAADRYAPCLQALLLFARPIITIGDFYYSAVLTILNVIPNLILLFIHIGNTEFNTCIYKILEIN